MAEKFSSYSTRLMGSNTFFNEPGAVLDVGVTFDQAKLTELLISEAERVLKRLNWVDYKQGYKVYSKGIRFAITAPIDLLWVACDVLDYIWKSVMSQYLKGKLLDLDTNCERLSREVAKAINLVFRATHAEARSRQLNVFSDDEGTISIGSGKYAYITKLRGLNLSLIPWDTIKEIPTVLVTGTNGKTTTVRLAAFIAYNAGKHVGYCSTDWVMVGDEIIETGDLSGPYGSRAVMMNPNVEMAILEVARGGLLRRGITADFVNAATVTNISEDHLGSDGVDTLHDLTDAKSLVYQAIRSDGYAIFNLDDIELRNKISTVNKAKIFITQNITNPDIQPFLDLAKHICYTENGNFYWRSCGVDELIISFADTPIAVNGFALHNIENAMHAIALSYTLGIDFAAIRSGLSSYQSTSENNYGRANTFNIRGGTVIVDFAHNAAGISAILHLAKAYLSDNSKLGILIGNTGNRKTIADSICQSVVDSNADFVIIKELSKYLRGTKPRELQKQLYDLLLQKGFSKENMALMDDELKATDYVIERIKPGDVYVLCCHESTGEVIRKLQDLIKPNK